MMILLLTNLSSQRDRRLAGSGAHAPRLVPAEETDDGPRQVPDFADRWSAFTVAGTAPEFRRLPFEPPPPDLSSVGGTLVGRAARRRAAGCQIARKPHYSGGHDQQPCPLVVLLSAIVAAAALRLVPHPPNFTPIGAMALFSGAYLGRRGLAFAAPLGALLLSDLVLGFYHGHGDRLFQPSR